MVNYCCASILSEAEGRSISRAMRWPDFILFASDATRYGLAGGALLLISAVAIWGDWRRKNRKNPDDVGIMPWRDIAALSTFAGLALMAFAAVGWISG